jgi:hypothetical protein
MKTPILFLIYNRANLTKISFEKIREIKPEKLYIAADGPKENDTVDLKKCMGARDIVKNIDWKCDIKILFRNKNLGCKYGVSSAIDWFFDNVDEGIILEDDCIPNESFFNFCETILNKYRENENIMHISGSTNKISENLVESYYFSHIAYIWGWATWKRAWKKYEVDPVLTKLNVYESRKIDKFWQSLFTKIMHEKVDTWDAQWLYAIMKNRGLCVTPTINMIENIGFGENATHTTFIPKNINKSQELKGEIIEPKEIKLYKNIDEFVTQKYYIQPTYKKIIWKIKQILKI